MSYKISALLSLLLGLFLISHGTLAMTMQEQIADIRAKIETEKQKNTELKRLLRQKENEISKLKQELGTIEEKISSLKQSHNIQ